ncbi:MAG: UDP-N-acetylmuramoyl-L-alanine--D-glutamate ligase [Methylococcales bacterium]|nr:UDP-N-acetylmuramoyl-L-alanine--D-glutamate ligase [Methylococcales bacterium]MBT7408568.1 UDP-N-acetylmuramoyl-L-alanine--D-glutamate ligase [Methylococcales bacterium]
MNNSIILIVGLGKTGLSCLKFLSQSSAQILINDSRKNPPGIDIVKKNYADCALVLGQWDKNYFERADEIVLSPGVSLQEPLVKEAIESGKKVYGDIELFVNHVDKPIVAITGSNGKSTVTTMVGKMAENANLNVKVGGNIGVPALDLLGDEKTDLYVLELSSFQLDTVLSLSADVAIVLNVSPDHMDRYSDMQHYTESKQKIYQNARVKVVNKDEIRVGLMVKAEENQVRFGMSEPGDNEFGIRKITDKSYLAYGNENWLNISQLGVIGEHNIANSLAALSIGQSLGFSKESMLQTLKTFSGLAHRTEMIKYKNGIKWINDSKATNVGASVAAIKGLQQPIIWIAGGEAKEDDFSELVKVVKNKVKLALLMGKDAKLIADSIQKEVPVMQVSSLKKAVIEAKNNATKGDVVLLSPACASFDQFKNFEDRGCQFKLAVEQVAQ